MSSIAAIGAIIAPAASSACRSPNARPRIRAAFRRRSCRRGEPRMPLPSDPRTARPSFQGSAVANGNKGLDSAARPSRRGSTACAAGFGREARRTTIWRNARCFGNAVDRAERRYRQAESHRNEGRQQGVIDLARQVDEQAGRSRGSRRCGEGKDEWPSDVE